MCIEEIQDAGDAKERLEAYFDFGKIGGDDVTKLSNMLDLLSNPHQQAEFRSQLEQLSGAIWECYNAPGIKDRANRFTSSIIKVGEGQGFSCQNNVVFVGALDGPAFGQNLVNRVLWKDSFALDHGEFSHSYQWLAAGQKFNWEHGTADLYSKLASVRSKVPLFVIDNGELAFRRAPLWEYMVDCTNYSEGKCGEAKRREAVNGYVVNQLAELMTGEFVDPFFADEYLRKVYREEFFQPNGKWKPEFDSRDKRARNVDEIARLLGPAPIQRRETLQFIAEQVAKFPKQNAITRSLDEKGTYRSPNNVTYLVRRESAWFINAYQIHRTGRRPPYEPEDYKELEGEQAKLAERGKLGERGTPGTKALNALFKNKVVKLVDADGQRTGATRKPTGREVDNRHAVIGKDRADQPITKALRVKADVGGRTETYTAVNRIEGSRYEQHKRFQGKPGFVETATNVYERAQDGRADNLKPQIKKVTYHGKTGKVNASVGNSLATIALSK